MTQNAPVDVLHGPVNTSHASPSPPLPIDEPARIAALDVLRGVALLGILTMNIRGMAGPFASYVTPLAMYDYSGLNRAAYWFTSLVFDVKMMSLFSALFGAGALVYAAKTNARGRPPTRLWFRRNVWLLVFGLIHGYLIWEGDILVVYALCGLIFLWWTRKLPPWALTLLAGVMFAIGGLIEVGHQMGFESMPPDEKAKELEFWSPPPEKVAEQIRTFRGGYWTIVRHRAPEVLETETFVFAVFFLWRAGGMMVLGQALMKWRILTGERSAPFYAGMAILGYAVGLPIVWIGLCRLEAIRYAVPTRFTLDLYNYFGSIAVALGHAGLILWIIRRGLLASLRARLAAVGRMAFTNYIMQSVLCTTLFYGYGFGLFGRADYAWQLLVVAGVWALELAWSSWWLRRFTFGPLEWLWRSLTYGRRPAFRRRAAHEFTVV